MVVDDELIIRLTIIQQLKDNNYEADAVEDANQALQKLENENWDVLLCDLQMPEMNGLELLQICRKRFPDLQVILMTAFGSVETAVTAIKEGAADYLTKPFRFPELDFRLRKLKEYSKTKKEYLKLKSIMVRANSFCGIIGRTPDMVAVFEQIQMFANHTMPVLITGETGTGKELVSKALHELGNRSGKPFIPVTCGAIPRDLAESEFFGHEKGAFTGASNKRLGHFERADGGTILLDDVDDLPLEIQAKLLRVLQEGTVMRIGSSKEIDVDVRLIATSKLNLEEVIEEKFRIDLYYRLRGLEIQLPPLRRRKDDILQIADHFLQILSTADKTAPKTLLPESANVLLNHDWPGNIRELRRVIETASVLSTENIIGVNHLPKYLINNNEPNSSLFSLHLNKCDSISFNNTIQQVENELIQWALSKSGGQQSMAADLLDLPRTTFQSKSKRTTKR
jgi:DNA-binding NtrC family response regulator